MSVNGITSTQASAYAYQTSAADTVKKEEKAAGTTAATAKASTSKSEESGVVYEPSTKTEAAESAKKTYKADTDLINKLKAETEARTSQLKELVEKLITKQATTYGNATDIWSFLKEGNFTVDPATKAQAQEDISEDGYWGVNKTSDRIIQFATALTGGDPDKIEEMREAFKKGYEKAGKTWGGDLPEISQKTYDAVMEKFDKLAQEAGIVTEQ